MSADDLYFKSVRELGDLLRRREISPVELTRGYLDRLQRLGPGLGAVATLTEELALVQARAAEQEIAAGRYRGPLHGVPFGVKDLLATQGIPTTWGAEPYRQQVFDHDATAVERLRQAGAVLVAKLAMVELAGGLGYNTADASWTGPGRTPWNRDYWSGGSSSGPGAAVAAGLVAFAIGSETSGSILTPAAFSGVTGLRPTYGRVSRFGAMALSWTLDKLGPMARSADDAALVLEAIAGPDPRDPSSLDAPFQAPPRSGPPERPGGGRLRVAVPKGAADKAQPEVRQNFEASLGVLGRFADVTREVDWPDFPWGPAVSAIVSAEGASAFLDLIESGRAASLRCARDRTGGLPATLLPAVDYLHAMRLRGPMRQAAAELFSRFDVVAAPTRQTISYPMAVTFDKAYPGVGGGPALIPAGNLCGLPAVAVPNGFGQNGLPTSLSLLGPALGEGTLVAAAGAYQDATDWHRRRPPGT
ncbi:MAG TPA: amidase [Candidatus Saccharimonadales bacterium]|nr:amidase [Candidatus Saccharimonadales bacterium]